MASVLQRHLAKRRQGVASGIYSVCSAHPWVIRAAAKDGSLLLIEATSNQVNQFGGSKLRCSGWWRIYRE